MKKKATQVMLDYINGLLKLEDKLILEYSKVPSAVTNIKDNWQQLNKIKEVVLLLIEEENEHIDASTDKAINQYHTEGFLLHLIDTTWKECTESSEVPSTGWAIKIINKATETFNK